MLKLKENKTFINEEEIKKIYDESYITKVGFYIGIKIYMNTTVSERLLQNIQKGLDEMVIFHLFCKFMVERFMGSDLYTICDYVDEYFDEDLTDFIDEYFDED